MLPSFWNRLCIKSASVIPKMLPTKTTIMVVVFHQRIKVTGRCFMLENTYACVFNMTPCAHKMTFWTSCFFFFGLCQSTPSFLSLLTREMYGSLFLIVLFDLRRHSVTHAENEQYPFFSLPLFLSVMMAAALLWQLVITWISFCQEQAYILTSH